MRSIHPCFLFKNCRIARETAGRWCNLRCTIQRFVIKQCMHNYTINYNYLYLIMRFLLGYIYFFSLFTFLACHSVSCFIFKERSFCYHCQSLIYSFFIGPFLTTCQYQKLLLVHIDIKSCCLGINYIEYEKTKLLLTQYFQECYYFFCSWAQKGLHCFNHICNKLFCKPPVLCLLENLFFYENKHK